MYSKCIRQSIFGRFKVFRLREAAGSRITRPLMQRYLEAQIHWSHEASNTRLRRRWLSTRTSPYTATFVTSRGDIVADLFPKDAPNTVNNFVFLAREGFYDGTTFHRVIADLSLMSRAAIPTGTGRGGPGYNFEDELKSNPRKHQVGSLSMANAGPNTNGSQFFITHIATDWLNGKHTVFGQIRSGQDIVDSVKQGDTLKNVKIEEA